MEACTFGYRAFYKVYKKWIIILLNKNHSAYSYTTTILLHYYHNITLLPQHYPTTIFLHYYYSPTTTLLPSSHPPQDCGEAPWPLLPQTCGAPPHSTTPSPAPRPSLPPQGCVRSNHILHYLHPHIHHHHPLRNLWWCLVRSMKSCHTTPTTITSMTSTTGHLLQDHICNMLLSWG